MVKELFASGALIFAVLIVGVLFSLLTVRIVIRIPVRWIHLKKWSKRVLRNSTRRVYLSKSRGITVAAFVIIALSLKFKVQTDAFDEAIFLFFVFFASLISVSYMMSKLEEVKSVFDNPITKIWAGVFGVMGLWMAHGSTSELLSKTFSIDSSNMPIALSAGIFLKCIGLLSIPVLLFAMIIEIFVIGSLVHVKKYTILSFLKHVSPIAAFFLVYESGYAMALLGQSYVSDYIIVSIATREDFVEHSFCKNVGEDERVLTLPSMPNYALVIKKTDPAIKRGVAQLSPKELHQYYPKKGRIIQCF